MDLTDQDSSKWDLSDEEDEIEDMEQNHQSGTVTVTLIKDSLHKGHLTFLGPKCSLSYIASYWPLKDNFTDKIAGPKVSFTVNSEVPL